MLKRATAFLALFALGTVDAQAATRPFPSLAKRPVETRDRTQDATPAPAEVAAPDPALAKTVDGLQAQATAADTAFRSTLDKGRASVSAASGAQPLSEPWIAAQMIISDADAARYDSVAALASLDTLQVDRQNSADGARVAADLATITPVRTRVSMIVDAQNDTLDSLKKTLTNP